MKRPLAKYTLVPADTYATASAGTTFDEVPVLGGHRSLMLVMKVTDADAASGDTLDVYADVSPDGGTTWLNAVHFTQVLGNGADALTFVAVLDADGIGTDVVAFTADAGAGKVRDYIFGNRLRARHVLVDGGAHGQSFTYSLVAYGLD